MGTKKSDDRNLDSPRRLTCQASPRVCSHQNHWHCCSSPNIPHPIPISESAHSLHSMDKKKWGTKKTRRFLVMSIFEASNIGLFEPYPYGHMGLGDPKIIFFQLKLYFGSTVYPVGLLYLYFCHSRIEVSPVETAAVYRHKNAVKPS